MQQAAAAARPQRLYWVPAVGVVPAIEHYRQEAGLGGVPMVPTADVAAVVLQATGEDQAPGLPRRERDLELIAGIQGLRM